MQAEVDGPKTLGDAGLTLGVREAPLGQHAFDEIVRF
jgi:hypothetical protein